MVKELQDGILVLNQPAGHVENNESILDAVIRETTEEAGWLVKPIGLIGFYAFTPFECADTYHRVCVLCDALSPTNTQLDPDIVSCHWMTYEEVMSKPHRSPLIKTCIEDSLNNPIISLSFLSNQHLSAVPTLEK